MLIVKAGIIQHNGKIYAAGEPLPKMKKEEADRLISLGVCALVPSAEAPAEDDSNSEEPESDEQDGKQAQDGEDEGNDAVNLNINPENAIKPGAKK